MSDSWMMACHALWGDDWIAPLSEVLDVNRRTVERWKSREIDIPAHIATELIRLPRLGSATRAYGRALRALACGVTLEEIEADAADVRRAAARLRADVGKFTVITVLAAGQSLRD